MNYFTQKYNYNKRQSNLTAKRRKRNMKKKPKRIKKGGVIDTYADIHTSEIEDRRSRREDEMAAQQRRPKRFDFKDQRFNINYRRPFTYKLNINNIAWEKQKVPIPGEYLTTRLNIPSEAGPYLDVGFKVPKNYNANEEARKGGTELRVTPLKGISYNYYNQAKFQTKKLGQKVYQKHKDRKESLRPFYARVKIDSWTPPDKIIEQEVLRPNKEKVLVYFKPPSRFPTSSEDSWAYAQRNFYAIPPYLEGQDYKPIVRPIQLNLKVTPVSNAYKALKRTRKLSSNTLSGLNKTRQAISTAYNRAKTRRTERSERSEREEDEAPTETHFQRLRRGALQGLSNTRGEIAKTRRTERPEKEEDKAPTETRFQRLHRGTLRGLSNARSKITGTYNPAKTRKLGINFLGALKKGRVAIKDQPNDYELVALQPASSDEPSSSRSPIENDKRLRLTDIVHEIHNLEDEDETLKALNSYGEPSAYFYIQSESAEFSETERLIMFTKFLGDAQEIHNITKFRQANQRATFTDYCREEDSGDLDKETGKFSKRLRYEDIRVRAWLETGGKFTNEEHIQLLKNSKETLEGLEMDTKERHNKRVEFARKTLEEQKETIEMMEKELLQPPGSMGKAKRPLSTKFKKSISALSKRFERSKTVPTVPPASAEPLAAVDAPAPKVSEAAAEAQKEDAGSSSAAGPSSAAGTSSAPGPSSAAGPSNAEPALIKEINTMNEKNLKTAWKVIEEIIHKEESDQKSIIEAKRHIDKLSEKYSRFDRDSKFKIISKEFVRKHYNQNFESLQIKIKYWNLCKSILGQLIILLNKYNLESEKLIKLLGEIMKQQSKVTKISDFPVFSEEFWNILNIYLRLGIQANIFLALIAPQQQGSSALKISEAVNIILNAEKKKFGGVSLSQLIYNLGRKVLSFEAHCKNLFEATGKDICILDTQEIKEKMEEHNMIFGATYDNLIQSIEGEDNFNIDKLFDIDFARTQLANTSGLRPSFTRKLSLVLKKSKEKSHSNKPPMIAGPSTLKAQESRLESERGKRIQDTSRAGGQLPSKARQIYTLSASPSQYPTQSPRTQLGGKKKRKKVTKKKRKNKRKRRTNKNNLFFFFK